MFRRMKPMARSTETYFVEAGARILDVLDLFSSNEEVQLAHVVSRLNMVKSTAFRMLYTLEKKGYIERVAHTHAYRRRVRHRIGFASISAKVPFAVEVNRGIENQAPRHDVDLVIAYNEFDPERTLRNVESFLAGGVQLVLEYNADEHISHVLADRCSRWNVPIVAITFPVPGAVTTFGVNNYRAGLVGGEGLARYVATAWKGHVDRVILLDILGSSPAQQARITGMIDGLKKFLTIPDETLLHVHADRSRNDAGKLLERILSKQPARYRSLVLSYNDDNALRAIPIIQRSGRNDQILMLCQGGVTAVREEMTRPGTCLWGAVAHFPERFGEHLLPILVRILRGQAVPSAIWTSHALLTRKPATPRIR